MVFGTGRFDFGFPLGDLDGGYGVVDVGSTHISGRYAKVRAVGGVPAAMQCNDTDDTND